LSCVAINRALHAALLKKSGNNFWKCWRSKFERPNKCAEVEGCVSPYIVSQRFADHFSKTFSGNNPDDRVETLKEEYELMRANYSGLPLTDVNIDIELVSRIILELKRGKAIDIDWLSADHLIYSHPILSIILSKMFNLMSSCQYISVRFKFSYVVPFPKIKTYSTKANVTCDDLRAIAIDPIISKVFEYSFLDRFNKYLTSADYQFGFKKKLGCSHAIYTCRNIQCAAKKVIMLYQKHQENCR